MKSIISFIVALGFVSLAIAQEESPSPSSEEKPSATVEEAPASTVVPAPKESAAPAKTSTAQKKESTAADSTSKKATTTPAASKPAKKMSVEDTLKDNENHWEAAVGSHDPSLAQKFVADDFSGVYWDGRVVGKSGLIAEAKKDKDTYKSAVNDKLTVHSFGPNVAVVVGTAHEKGTGKDGKPFDRTYRFTDTWVMRNGQWQCVAFEIMKVKG
ncbi:MAG TPA: DUF4440 domain-containing protein [Chthoniobacterales bacterium]|nr:DUF4440 domain-containing protein [Chthoniobacterales bacterium]